MLILTSKGRSVASGVEVEQQSLVNQIAAIKNLVERTE
jgi:hypothetical protein